MNIDINIWDRVAYETSGDHSGGWEMRAYRIAGDGYGYGTGEMTDHNLVLRAKDVVALGLGEDEDFWIDGQSLLEDSNTPRRVRRWVINVMEEVESERVR